MRIPGLDDLPRDFRHALRSLRRTPGFALVAVLTLGVGLGANAAIFGVLDAALFRPLPYPEGERIVTLHLTTSENPFRAPGPQPSAQNPELFSWSYPKFEVFRKTVTSYTAVAGYAPLSLNLQSPDGPERVEAEEVSPAYFALLGLRPAAGRLLQPGEDGTPGQPAEIVLSHAFWKRRFGGDPGIVGRQLGFSGLPLTVIGVAPEGFTGLTGTAEAFVPITLATIYEYPEILQEAGNHWFQAVGRLKPASTLTSARSEAAIVGSLIDRQYRFPQQTGRSATVQQLAASRVDPGFRRSVLLLAGAVGVVLLIACVNLTGLLLVRAVARRRELAVRLALGASRGRLVRQVLTEALALSLAGWIVGVALARFGIRLLTMLAPGQGRGRGGVRFLFDPATVTVDTRVVLFALGLSVIAALLVGIVPALQGSRPGVTQGLRAGGGSSTAKGHLTLRRPGLHQVLVISEVALALMLLVGAGLLLRSFARLQAVQTGFDPGNLLTFRYAAAEGDRAGRDPRAFKQELVERLAALPGVSAASVSNCAPLSGPCSVSVVARIDDRRFERRAGAVQVGLHTVTPSYFTALGIPILRGRGFDASDRGGGPRVVVISETAARRLFREQDPLGHRVSAAQSYFRGGDSTAEVIGIARDVRYGPVESEPMPDFYLPAYQTTFGASGVVFVRVQRDPLALIEAARQEVGALDPGLPIFNVRTMEERAGAALARPRFATTLLGTFAAMALVLAAVGLYGVMAFSVAQRTREIGLRMALGADAPSVLRGVLGQGLALAGSGVVLGLLGALALQRVLGGMLYGIAGTDPATLAGVSLLMGTAATIAALIPARRAIRVDPMEALRAE